MLVSDAIAQFLEHRRGAGVSSKTLTWYDMWLSRWATWRGDRDASLSSVSADELRCFFRYLREEHTAYQDHPNHPNGKRGLKPQSVHGAWQVVRSLWRYLEQEYLLTDDQITYFPQRVPRPRVEQVIRPIYTVQDVDSLVRACENDNPELESRDRAVVLLLYESGMRVGELCSLAYEHLDCDKRQARVRGKTGWRYVYWGPRGAAALAVYLAHRRMGRGQVFRVVGGGAITYNTVRQLFRRLSQRAGIDLQPGAAIHALRHSFAHVMLDRGTDGLHLQQIMGHKSQETTARYVREHPEQLRTVHARVWAV